jgi:hypothetical protein
VIERGIAVWFLQSTMGSENPSSDLQIILIEKKVVKVKNSE